MSRRRYPWEERVPDVRRPATARHSMSPSRHAKRCGDAARNALLLALFLSGTLAWAEAAHAASKTIDMAALRKMVGGLGLEDSGDGKTFVKVENQGSRGLTIDDQPNTDGSDVLVYAPLATVPADSDCVGMLASPASS